MAAAFGLNLDPWQQLVMLEALKKRIICDECRIRPNSCCFNVDNPDRPIHLWAAKEVGLMVSRQNGKNSILEAVELAGLLLFGERLIIHTGQEAKTAKEAQRRLSDLLDSHGAEYGVKYKATQSNGMEGIELIGGSNSGARVMFQTRTAKAGLGLSADRVICDEAMFITPESIQVLLFTLSARPNTQIWYTGSAADEVIHPDCHIFAGVRARGIAKTGNRLCYLEWSAPDDADPAAIESVAMSNPALGRRISLEDVQTEYQTFHSTDNMRAFGVQRLGIGHWPVLGGSRSDLPKDKWLTLKDPSPELVGDAVSVLYRAPEGGPWAIAAAQRTSAGKVHVEVGYSGSDPANVVLDRYVEVLTTWGLERAFVGRGAADAATTKLEAAGFAVETANLMEEAQACGGLLDEVLAENPALSHGGRDDLNTAAGSAVKKGLPSGGFVWENVSENTYPTLMAATLARWALIKYAPRPVGPMIHSATDEEIEEWLNEDFDAWLNDDEEHPVD